MTDSRVDLDAAEAHANVGVVELATMLALIAELREARKERDACQGTADDMYAKLLDANSQLREAREALELLYGDIREGGLSPSGKFIAVLVPLETARVIRRALKGASDGE